MSPPSDYWFPKRPFNEEFPSIRSIEIEYTQVGDGVDNRDYPKFLYKEPPLMCSCSNPDCRNGGVSVYATLAVMVGERNSTKEYSDRCDGRDSNNNRCWNRFDFKIQVEYDK